MQQTEKDLLLMRRIGSRLRKTNKIAATGKPQSRPKVLNLYAGIGGNRKLWKDVEVTAVEYDESIAAVYQKHFPKDTVVVGDAHEYLLKHYKDGWNFIWASPPCPSHSRMRYWGHFGGKFNATYPDMKLYQEIIFLSYHAKCKYVIENVFPYYTPLIEAQKIGRHMFWTNFSIRFFDDSSISPEELRSGAQGPLQKAIGFNLEGVKLSQRKDKVLRNCVLPELGKHIFDCAMGSIVNEKQLDIFETIAG